MSWPGVFQAGGFIDQAKSIALASLSKENNMSRLADEAEAIADQWVCLEYLYNAMYEKRLCCFRHEQESLSVVSAAQYALDTSTNALNAMQNSITALNELIDSFDEMNE